MKLIRCDVLIIGAGGAGLRAAIEAKETFKKGKILLVTKGSFGASGVTATACSDRMAFHATLPYTEPGGSDNWKYHAEDIYRIGGFVSDGDLAMILAKESQIAWEYLDRLGVPFVKREEGRADQFITDGSEYARACYTGPRTANHIEEALVKKVASMDIRIIEYCMIADLIKYRGRVIGAFGIDEREKTGIRERLNVFSSKTIILATGGAGEVFETHVFPEGMTGDGYALAYRAGAELVNMEFIQIGPASIKTRLNCSGSLMRAVPRFLNEKGEEFLKNYLPGMTSLAEMSNLVFEKGASWPVSLDKKTHLIDVAMFKEITRGHRVFLDYRTNPEGFQFDDLDPKWQQRYESEIKEPIPLRERARSPLDRLTEINPESIEWLKEHGIDLRSGERMEVAPCIQHFQGGVKIREKGNTSLKGLYAAGECAGGQHGANRPGGNALLDGQVFGKISGREAALEAIHLHQKPGVPSRCIDQFLLKLNRMKNGERPLEIRKSLQSITSSYASVVRTPEGLRKGLKRLEVLRRKVLSIERLCRNSVHGSRTSPRTEYDMLKINQLAVRPERVEGRMANYDTASDETGPIYALETEHLLDVAEMVLRACLTRKESRGPHLFFNRFDDPHPLPSQDPKWRKYIVIQNRSGKMVLKKEKPVAINL